MSTSATTATTGLKIVPPGRGKTRSTRGPVPVLLPEHMDKIITLTLTADFLTKACTVKAAGQCRGEAYVAGCHCFVAQAAHFTRDMESLDGRPLEFYRCPSSSLHVKVGRLPDGVEADSPEDKREVVELCPATTNDRAEMASITGDFDYNRHEQLQLRLPVTLSFWKP